MFFNFDHRLLENWWNFNDYPSISHYSRPATEYPSIQNAWVNHNNMQPTMRLRPAPVAGSYIFWTSPVRYLWQLERRLRGATLPSFVASARVMSCTGDVMHGWYHARVISCTGWCQGFHRNFINFKAIGGQNWKTLEFRTVEATFVTWKHLLVLRKKTSLKRSTLKVKWM